MKKSKKKADELDVLDAKIEDADEEEKPPPADSPDRGRCLFVDGCGAVVVTHRGQNISLVRTMVVCRGRRARWWEVRLGRRHETRGGGGFLTRVPVESPLAGCAVACLCMCWRAEDHQE